jgi:cyanophycin synthetase
MIKSQTPSPFQSKLAFIFLKEEALKQGYDFLRLTDQYSETGFEEGKKGATLAIHQVTDPFTNRYFTIKGPASYPDLTPEKFKLTEDKALTQKILEEEGLPFPKTWLIQSSTDLEKTLIEKFVLKPNNAAHGDGVHFIENADLIESTVQELLRNHPSLLLQEFIEGKDLRIQAVCGKLFAACLRIPANITGDGSHTVQELVDLKNLSKLPANHITVDEDVLQRISSQLTSNGNNPLQLTPQAGQQIFLREAANIGQGGDPVDVTNKLHPDYQKLVKKVAQKLELQTFAIDCITSDEGASLFPPQPSIASEELHSSSTRLLEINAPCMWAHHHFAEGQKRNVALAILDSYLHPERFNPKDERYLI